MSLGDYVDDALRATRALGNVTVIGHSMGGLIGVARGGGRDRETVAGLADHAG